MELGRLPSIYDNRTLRLASYLPLELPPVPNTVRWYEASKGRFSLGANNIYGNCVTVTAANMINSANAVESGVIALIPDQDIVEQARQIDGLYGMTILERLKHWRKQAMFGSQIQAFAQAPAKSIDILKFIIHTFGAADIGVWMPAAWRESMHFWDVGSGSRYRPGSWGGHSVPFIGYEPHGRHGTMYQAVSWGRITEVTEAAVLAYVDEIWACILPDWYEHDEISPSGLRLNDLMKDLEYVTAI